MTKAIFKQYNQGQICMFPMSLDEKISPNAPVRLVNQIVDNLDISKVFDTYKGGGTSSYHPRMMLKLVLYAYLNNIYRVLRIYALWVHSTSIHAVKSKNKTLKTSITCGFPICKLLTITPLTTFVPRT